MATPVNEMCQRCSLAVRPTGRHCPTFIKLSLLMHQDRRLHTNFLPAMDYHANSWTVRRNSLRVSKVGRRALKKYRQCIQIPKNTTRCCLIYKDEHNLRALKSQMSLSKESDRGGWLKHTEVQAVYTEEQSPACSLQLAVQSLFN